MRGRSARVLVCLVGLLLLATTSARAQYHEGQDVQVERWPGQWVDGKVVQQNESGVLVRLPADDGSYDPARCFQYYADPARVRLRAAGAQPQPDPQPKAKGKEYAEGQDVEIETGSGKRRGKVVRQDGSGILVRFPMPDGSYDPARAFQAYYQPGEVRKLGEDAPVEQPKERQPGGEPQEQPEEVGEPQPGQGDEAGKQPEEATADPAEPEGEGLLSKEEVIAYARQTMGPNPWQNPPRDENLAKIRDYVRTRGTKFLTERDFQNRMDAQASMSSHIFHAVNNNYGPHPQLSDYFGAWQMQSGTRQHMSEKPKDDHWVVRTTTDAVAINHETLIINPDHTYIWKLSPRDPPEKFLRGTWREMKMGEMQMTEAGPALMLERARLGNDYMVRMDREKGWRGWIDVGIGKERSAIEWGHR